MYILKIRLYKNKYIFVVKFGFLASLSGIALRMWPSSELINWQAFCFGLGLSLLVDASLQLCSEDLACVICLWRRLLWVVYSVWDVCYWVVESMCRLATDRLLSLSGFGVVRLLPMKTLTESCMLLGRRRASLSRNYRAFLSRDAHNVSRFWSSLLETGTFHWPGLNGSKPGIMFAGVSPVAEL